MLNGIKMNVEKGTSNGMIAELPHTTEVELYNFGHAPLEVIHRFQEFCMKYTSLTEALLDILERESMLKKKYTFIAAPVMYQMLAKPTSCDSELLLTSTIDALKMFTKRGRYDSVSNAIEELLFSPFLPSLSCCDQATWTGGNVGSNFTELSQDEQSVLEKIADALVVKLPTVIPKKRRRKPTVKPPKIPDEGNKSTKTTPKKRKSQDSNVQKTVKLTQTNRLGENANGGTKFSSNHLRPSPVGQSLHQSRAFDSPDSSIAIPIKNYLTSSCVPSRKKIRLCRELLPSDLRKEKEDFFEECLELIPSLDSID